MSESAGRVVATLNINEVAQVYWTTTVPVFHMPLGNYVPEQLLVEAEERLDREREFIRKLDGIIEEVGGVTASCINPYEDLKRALIGQKQRAESAESKLASVRALADELNTFRFHFMQGTAQTATLDDMIERLRALTETIPSEERK